MADYYIYFLLKPDKTPFYVGKGKLSKGGRYPFQISLRVNRKRNKCVVISNLDSV